VFAAFFGNVRGVDLCHGVEFIYGKLIFWSTANDCMSFQALLWTFR